MPRVSEFVIPVKKHILKYLLTTCNGSDNSIHINGKSSNIDLYILFNLLRNRKNIYYSFTERPDKKDLDFTGYCELHVHLSASNDYDIGFDDPINVYYFNRFIDIKFRKEMIAFVEGARESSEKGGDMHFIHAYLEKMNITEDDIPFTTIHRYFFRNK